MRGSGLLKYAHRTFKLFKNLRQVRDRRRLGRVQLRGHTLLTSLLLQIWGGAPSLRAATDKRGGVLARAPVRRLLFGQRAKLRAVAAHASTLYAYLRQVFVGHLERLNVHVCKRLKGLRALYWEGVVMVALDATGLSTPKDHYAEHGTLSQTRTKKTKDGKEVQVKSYYYLLSNLFVVGAAVPAWLGFKVATVGETEASRAVLEWARSPEGYGPRFIDVLLADQLYCNQNDLRNFSEVANDGWIVRANRNCGCVADALRLLELEEWSTTRVKGDDTRVRAVELQWPEVADRGLRLFQVHWDGGGPLLFVTNLPWVLPRLARGCRERWGVENNLHRELKQEWGFRSLPSRSLNGMKAWWWLLAIAYNLFHAYLGRQVEPRQPRNGGYSSLRVAKDALKVHLANAGLGRLHRRLVDG